MIEYSSREGATPGYLSLPKGKAGPGLVVIQEWWGLIDHIKTVADRFAAAGFVTLAPDLYHGQTTKSPDDARKMLMALDIANAALDMRAAAQHLAALPNVAPKKVGITGFCMGGQLALYAASEYPDQFAACVDFYGVHPNAQINPHKLQVPVLAHFGKEDDLVKKGTVSSLIKQVEDAGKFIDVYYYEAGHAFFNDTRPEAYDADAAALAWDRTLAFLRDSLR